ncbi:MAG TPA: M1 family metallopeptidase [Candidatus Binatia bacterium]|nr:M1 family metallopeptidase [Candidatus Binatia bacterium]
MAEPKNYRLPTSVAPERYELRLAPDLASWTFTGTEVIAVAVHEPVQEIVLNAAELELQSVFLRSADGRSTPGQARLESDTEQAILSFGGNVAPGRYQLELHFSGVLNDKLHGFYRSTYKDADGRERRLASTQFESTDARRAFPCWDEPAIKAVFQVTLLIDPGLTAISNARALRQTVLSDSGKKEVVFADTMKMSTYLVAFIVGEFEATEAVLVDHAPLRVWAVPGKRHLTEFALEIGKASLEHFSRYYDLPYPGDKLDLVAIPDFASGAMENLGAITFRETALLVDRDRATRAELERVADVVSHENAHMWFGDLVTMQWWNGLWLNEAFATFMEMLAVDAWKPEWRRWESFTVSRAAAMQVDGLKSTRPIEFRVDRPEEAAGMFDVLTYEKGASVLRMLEQYLGAAAFRDGIRLYLRRHAYGNAETTDLWDALEQSTRLPARAVMDSWIFQPGYPLITVASDGSRVSLTQQLFRYLPDSSDGERRWSVPIFLRAGTQSGIVEKVLLLRERQQSVDLETPVDWVVVNAGGHGFYRVRYSGALLESLQAALATRLSAVERFGLINDMWAAAQAGLASLTDYLELIALLSAEADVNVWTTVIGSGHYLERVLADSQIVELAARFRALLTPAVERLGWSARAGESELDSQLRGDLIGALGAVAQDADCQRRARELFAEYESAPEKINRNLVPALIAIVAHTGSITDYEKFYNRFKTAATPQDETRYLFALANFPVPELIDRTLQLTLSGEVRTQNAPYLMRGVLLNRRARRRAWEFLKAHWDAMVRHYPDNAIPRMCEGIIGLAEPDLQADASAFFSDHPVKYGLKQMEQHLERLRVAVLCGERWRSWSA